MDCSQLAEAKINTLAKLHYYDYKNSMNQPIVIRIYKGRQAQATSAFQADAARMAAQGYRPISQAWAPGAYGCGSFLAALLLCLVLVGFIVFIYMLIVKPPGTLTVTYELRSH